MRLASVVRALVVGGALAFLGGCGGPRYEEVQAVFTRSCAVGTTACHAPAGNRGELVLTADVSHAQLVNRPSTQVARLMRVRPGDPAQSWLVNKIEGTHCMVMECTCTGSDPGCVRGCRTDCGQRMPMVGGVLLEESEVRLIREWVAAGAPAR